jgi:hypothetical protein
MTGRLAFSNAEKAARDNGNSLLFISTCGITIRRNRFWHGLCSYTNYNSLKFNKIARGLGGLDRQSLVAGHYPSGIINERLFIMMDKQKSTPGLFEKLGNYDSNADEIELMMDDEYRQLMNYLLFLSLG